MRAYDSVDLRGAHAGGPGQHIFILRRHRDRRGDATIVLNRDGRRVYPIRPADRMPLCPGWEARADLDEAKTPLTDESLKSYPSAQRLCDRIRPFHCRQMTAVLHNAELRSGDSVRHSPCC
jgi:hypothetical protein